MSITVQLNKTKSFLDRILEKLPEADREAVRAEYSAAQDEVAGVARELDDRIQAVNTTHAKQTKWWNDHGIDPATGQPRVAATNPDNRITAAVDEAKLRKDFQTELERTADTLAAQGLFLATKIPTIIAQHGVEFGEVLDGEKLTQDAMAAKQDVVTFYNAWVAERRKTKAAEVRAKEIADAEERGRVAGLKQAGKDAMPYPTTRAAAPTTLSGLRPLPEGQKNEHTLDAAINTAVDVMNRQAAAAG